MRYHGKSFWKTVPFLRLLVPFTGGVVLGFCYQFPLVILLAVASLSFLLFIAFRWLPNTIKYRQRWIAGVCCNFLMLAGGCLVMYGNDPRNNKDWIGYHNFTGITLAVTLQEPLTSRERSYKTIARIDHLYSGRQWQPASGKLLLYLSKDTVTIPGNISYGTQLIIQATLQPIRNSGNPGGFDYRQYCGFQGIYHQAFITGDHFITLKKAPGGFMHHLYVLRDKILAILIKNIHGEKEAGVAEALLLGYRNDLDKDLVQAYSSTGVVHIIAISGLHLGMIYGLLAGMFSVFPRKKILKWMRPFTIILILWLFSLLTGAAASILRSAVMFTFIVTGESIGRRTNVYNTLAASAFLLLLYNPYFLWDVGFLLSYTAVTSIVIFMKPVYRWLFIKNKLLNIVWQLNAVTLSAQILTLPLILYCFHQFPNLFLFTNAVAVPLSGLILYAELALLLVAGIPFICSLTGSVISFLVAQMNGYIERTASLPFAVTDNIHISFIQSLVLYACIFAFGWWLFRKQKTAFCAGICLVVVFLFERCLHLARSRQQQKMIVYNIPKKTAIDIIEGRNCRFIGQQEVTAGQLYNFHIRPARIHYQAAMGEKLNHVFVSPGLVISQRKQVLVLSQWHVQEPPGKKIPMDIIILCGSPSVSIPLLQRYFICTQYVFDSSNPLWKIQYWKKEADSLHLRHHSTSEQGAFEVDL